MSAMRLKWARHDDIHTGQATQYMADHPATGCTMVVLWRRGYWQSSDAAGIVSERWEAMAGTIERRLLADALDVVAVLG